MAERFIAVAVPRPLRREFTYLWPDSLGREPEIGLRVRVPFARREVVGYLVAADVEKPAGNFEIKPVLEILDEKPLLPDALLRMGRFMADYYFCSLGEALDAMLPAHARKEKNVRSVKSYRLAISEEVTKARIAATAVGRSQAQAKLLTLLDTCCETFLTAAEIEARCGVSAAVLRTLEKQNILEIQSEEVLPEFGASARIDPAPVPEMNPDQAAIVERIRQERDKGRGRTHVLRGVTGSGKTEVYLRVLADILRRGLSAIVLVPEISLTPQTVSRFRARFPKLAVLHSGLTDVQRYQQWRRIQSGEATLVVGARSAIFAPFRQLGLIVVDEEHEPSYKQESSPRYHARDLAVWRGAAEGATVILGSATPSLESMYNVTEGRFLLDTLDKRVLDLSLPPVEVISLAQEFRDRKRLTIFSRALEKGIEGALARKEQTLLFLNRRGFHRTIACARCGWRLGCPHCGVDLVYHKMPERALCHFCGHEVPVPRSCPDCYSEEVRFQGFGAQQVEEEIIRYFPAAKVARMDSDSMTSRELYDQTLEAFGRGEIDILVGTQMIAKGLHFPNITVIGLIQADGALSMPDFRAAERTFQLITQVAGRTGRGEKPGRVFLQAFNVDHYAVRLGTKQDYDGFLALEMPFRKELGYPPYTRLARILVQGREAEKVRLGIEGIAARLTEAAKRFKIEVILRGPAPCPLEKIQDEFRHHLLLSAPDGRTLANFLNKAEKDFALKGPLSMTLDVDPSSLL